jgi:hypothetical protein
MKCDELNELWVSPLIEGEARRFRGTDEGRSGSVD